MQRHRLPDGATLIVHGQLPTTEWDLEIEGRSEARLVGTPLNSALAELLGYQVAHEDWPTWIDDLAARIESARK